MSHRMEKDSMGEMKVPADAYYGATTARALVNFPISGTGFSRRFLKSIGLLKGAAATVNHELGFLEDKETRAIEKAAEEVAAGQHDNHFVVDIFQTGSGTSTNMNANEVLANRATEILGGDLGSKLVHPNDHVNRGQSSNDVIPSAMQLSVLLGIEKELIPALEKLAASLKKKSEEFWEVVKTGRTHLQDATPIRMGQVFLGFAGQVERSVRRLKFASAELSELPLGGTAVGTGINTHPQFASKVVAQVGKKLGVTISETDNHFQAQNNVDSMIVASGVLRTVALSLYKVANDIRYMGSGPRAGYGELKLPEVQPGSSIMPGKVNPVIAESLLMVVAHVQGNDTAVVHGAYGSNFELNTMFPVCAHNLNKAIDLLTASVDNFRTACVEGLEATSAGPDSVERGLMLGTALAPVVGYDKAAAIAKKAAASGQTIREVARQETDLDESQLEAILEPKKMTAPDQEPAKA